MEKVENITWKRTKNAQELILEVKDSLFKNGTIQNLVEFGIPLRDTTIRATMTKPQTKFKEFQSALQYNGKHIPNVHKKVVQHLRTTLRMKITPFIRNWISGKKEEIGKIVEEKVKTGKVNEEYSEKLEKVLTHQLWQNYDRMTREAAEFVEDVFPMKLVKKIRTFQKEWGTTNILTWDNLDPCFLFECWDDQAQYWDRIKWRVDNLVPPHDCWTNFLAGLEPPKVTPKNETDLKRTNTIFGRELTVDGRKLRHILPPVQSQKILKIPLLACNFSLKTGHTKKGCTEAKGGKKKKGTEKRYSGYCTNCGNRGHQEKWCKSSKKCCRCNNHSHTAELTNDCPIIKSQRAFNRRIQILLNYSRKPINKEVMRAYVHWYNNLGKPRRIMTNEDQRKRKRGERSDKKAGTTHKRVVIRDFTTEEEAKEDEESQQEQPQKKRNLGGAIEETRTIETNFSKNDLFSEFNFNF